MSHWQAGKIKARCSIREMIKALTNIKGEWAKFIKTDPSGGLDIYNSYTRQTESGFHLTVPGGGREGTQSAPGLRYADIGMKYSEGKGEWSFFVDPMGLPPDMRNFEGRLLQEITRLHSRALGAQEGMDVTETRMGGQIKIRMKIPVTEAYKLRGLAS